MSQSADADKMYVNFQEEYSLTIRSSTSGIKMFQLKNICTSLNFVDYSKSFLVFHDYTMKVYCFKTDDLLIRLHLQFLKVFNPFALRTAKTPYSVCCSECAVGLKVNSSDCISMLAVISFLLLQNKRCCLNRKHWRRRFKTLR